MWEVTLCGKSFEMELHILFPACQVVHVNVGNDVDPGHRLQVVEVQYSPGMACLIIKTCCILFNFIKANMHIELEGARVDVE